MKKLFAMVASAAFISGCASIELDTTAAKVIASPNPAPKSCKYLGQAVGNQGNFFTGGFTSNKNLEAGSMNDLRNQAAKLGGNYIQMIVNRAGVTGSYNSANGNGGGSSEQTNVTNLGNVYKCKPSDIGL
jgi:hypothetical protein